MEKLVRWLLQFASKNGSLGWKWKRDIGTVGGKEGAVPHSLVFLLLFSAILTGLSPCPLSWRNEKGAEFAPASQARVASKETTLLSFYRISQSGQRSSRPASLSDEAHFHAHSNRRCDARLAAATTIVVNADEMMSGVARAKACDACWL